MWRLMKTKAVGITVGAMLVFLFLVVFGQIVMRGLGHPFVWGEELSIIAFIWLVFGGTALAYQRKEHLEIDLVYEYARSRWGDHRMIMWDIAIGFLQLVFLCVFAVGLVMMAIQTWDISLGAVSVLRYGWIYLGVTAAIVLSIVVEALQIAVRLRRGHNR